MTFFGLLDLLDRLRSNEIWNGIRSRDLFIIPLLISGLWKRARNRDLSLAFKSESIEFRNTHKSGSTPMWHKNENSSVSSWGAETNFFFNPNNFDLCQSWFDFHTSLVVLVVRLPPIFFSELFRYGVLQITIRICHSVVILTLRRLWRMLVMMRIHEASTS